MSIRSEVVAALRQAGRRLTRAELLEHAPSALDDEKKLASNLYVMKTDGIVLTTPGEDGLEYELGPNADTVVADTSTPAHQVAPPQPSRKARALRSRPAAKRSPRNQERKAPPVKRSRTRRTTPKTRIILATARDLAAGVVGNVARSARLLRVVLDSELAEKTPTIDAALEQLDAAVSLCETGLRASGGGA